MTMPESQPEPEPPSRSSLRNGLEPSKIPGIHWHIHFESGVESIPEALTEDFIARCCRETLSEQALLDLAGVSDLELSVQLLDREAMRALNLQYRQKDLPTNILSFASEMPLMVADNEAATNSGGGALLILGDLVLCPDVIYREASEQAKLPLQHWAHMLVHGTLHLCGYDHEDGQEALVMEAIEIRTLAGLGIPDPYAVSDAVNKQ